MTKDEARILFMDLMYGELEASQQKELELFIDEHEDLKAEYNELIQTRVLLQHLPVQSPEEQLVIMAPETSSETVSENGFGFFLKALIPTSMFARTSFGLATFIFLFVMMGALTNMNISSGSSGFSISFGEQPPVQVGYSAAQVELIINQVQRENTQLVNEIVAAAKEQQDAQFQQTLTSFADYINEQRTTDLEIMNFGLTSLEETTYNRFRQTDQVLGEIIQTVSTN